MKEPRSVRDLVALLEHGARSSYYFFWGHHARDGVAVGKWCLSQWWPVAFDIDGVTYASAEHFMMAAKARLFGDDDALERILVAPDPPSAKKLGRAVRGFDEATWVDHRFDLVVTGNLAKFGQHPDLRAFLTSIYEDVIVEASPRDRIWGIGLGESGPHARDPRRWRGQNLLGFALMEVRAQLRRQA